MVPKLRNKLFTLSRTNFGKMTCCTIIFQH